MKKVIFNEKEYEVIKAEDIDVYNDILGFVDSNGDKGYTVYVGHSEKVSAVSMREMPCVVNVSHGGHEENRHKDIESLMNLNGSAFVINELYKFDSKKELFEWLLK
jgi:hypothetical protein